MSKKNQTESVGVHPFSIEYFNTQKQDTQRFGERWTIQKAICCMLKDRPETTPEEIVFWIRTLPDFAFSINYDLGRAKVDINKYNEAVFKCQKGIVPEIKAMGAPKNEKQAVTTKGSAE